MNKTFHSTNLFVNTVKRVFGSKSNRTNDHERSRKSKRTDLQVGHDANLTQPSDARILVSMVFLPNKSVAPLRRAAKSNFSALRHGFVVSRYSTVSFSSLTVVSSVCFPRTDAIFLKQVALEHMKIRQTSKQEGK